MISDKKNIAINQENAEDANIFVFVTNCQKYNHKIYPFFLTRNYRYSFNTDLKASTLS